MRMCRISKEICRINNKDHLTVSENCPSEKTFHPVQGAAERLYENILLAYKAVYNESHCIFTDFHDHGWYALTFYRGEWEIEQTMEAYKRNLFVAQLKNLPFAATQDRILSDIDSSENLCHGKPYNH